MDEKTEQKTLLWIVEDDPNEISRMVGELGALFSKVVVSDNIAERKTINGIIVLPLAETVAALQQSGATEIVALMDMSLSDLPTGPKFGHRYIAEVLQKIETEAVLTLRVVYNSTSAPKLHVPSRLLALEGDELKTAALEIANKLNDDVAFFLGRSQSDIASDMRYFVRDLNLVVKTGNEKGHSVEIVKDEGYVWTPAKTLNKEDLARRLGKLHDEVVDNTAFAKRPVPTKPENKSGPTKAKI